MNQSKRGMHNAIVRMFNRAIPANTITSTSYPLIFQVNTSIGICFEVIGHVGERVPDLTAATRRLEAIYDNTDCFGIAVFNTIPRLKKVVLFQVLDGITHLSGYFKNARMFAGMNQYAQNLIPIVYKAGISSCDIGLDPNNYLDMITFTFRRLRTGSINEIAQLYIGDAAFYGLAHKDRVFVMMPIKAFEKIIRDEYNVKKEIR